MESEVCDSVREYYDQNTRLFAKHESALADAVHRSVWAPGVTSDEASYYYVNQLILENILELQPRFSPPLRVADLGCGVGGTVFFICKRAAAEAVGVTLSPVQAEVATDRARQLQLDGQCRFLVGSYLDLPPLDPHVVAYAIESFVHGPNAAGFFASAAALIPSGGRLIVCDDFLTVKGAANDSSGSRRSRLSRFIADFRWGWHLHSLISMAAVRECAAQADFTLIEDRDLTPYLALRRPWDRFISLCVGLGRLLPLKSAWWRSWVGSHGGQMCLVNGLTEYRFLVFEKK